MNDSAPEMITSAAAVIDALGGTVAAAKVAGTLPQAMTNARAKNRLPYPSFLLMVEALSALGKTASPELWGIKGGSRMVKACRPNSAAEDGGGS